VISTTADFGTRRTLSADAPRRMVDAALAEATAVSAPVTVVIVLEAVDLAEREDLLECVLDDLRELPAVVLGALAAKPRAFTQKIVHTLDRHPASVARTAEPRRALPDPLRPQELKVLRYLGSRLTQREIAAELYISINTMKTHVKAIYRKLDVGTRRDAIERGRHLGLA
jgi:LuxR family transcriptional regulator, maltose regulon positive regulatory protein